jgi:hypothetical protein
MFCGDRERSDIITGAGSGVITDMDSTLTDMRNGFRLVRTEKVDAVLSIPGETSTSFSTQAASWFMAGVNKQGDTLRASLQFRASNGASRYNSGDELEGAYLYFRAADNDTIPRVGIDVFSSAPVKEISPISGTADGDNEKTGNFTMGRIDSLRLDDVLAESIFNTRTSEKADTLPFAFSILDYKGNVRKINNPYVILRVKRAQNGNIVRDSIPSSFTFFTAFENSANINERTESPYSSQHTLRTAIFKIDIGGIITAAESAEIINATLSFKFDEAKSVNANDYKVVVLDELLTGKDSLERAALHGSAGHFTRTATSRLNKKGNVHSIKTVIRNIVDKPNSKYIYVYLRPTSDHSVIMWDKTSLKVEAVLTPSR